MTDPKLTPVSRLKNLRQSVERHGSSQTLLSHFRKTRLSFLYMYVCILCGYLNRLEEGIAGVANHPRWALATEFGSSERAANALNY